MITGGQYGGVFTFFSFSG